MLTRSHEAQLHLNVPRFLYYSDKGKNIYEDHSKGYQLHPERSPQQDNICGNILPLLYGWILELFERPF